MWGTVHYFKIKNLGESREGEVEANVETLEIQMIYRYNRSAASPVFAGSLAKPNTEEWFPQSCSAMQFSIRKQQSVVSISVKHKTLCHLSLGYRHSNNGGYQSLLCSHLGHSEAQASLALAYMTVKATIPRQKKKVMRNQ